jgi:Tfp pilus assembly protein PilF/tRNA A-37 threonylcarbamoyl transferase component Bud32
MAADGTGGERSKRSSDGGGRSDSAEVMAALQASLGESYVVERELSGGGMSRVFVARESRLHRTVVVKLLATDLSASLSTERFEREIRVAAALQQANIVPLLSAGRSDDVPYYTMPFVDGQSLRDHLDREGALPVRLGINVLRDIARALAYAHAHGVVHRDIKPGNVLLSGGTAVVTDFGIAKALSAALDDGRQEALTLTGIGIGTSAYMAPEQAAGDPSLDHRADFYALGCLAYELFTGGPPFRGPSHAVVAAHFRDVPPSLISARPDLPAAVATLVARCLEKDPARRPQSATEILDALDASVDMAAASGVASRLRGRVMAGTAVVAAVLAVGLVVARVARRPAAQASASRPAPAGSENSQAFDEYRLGQALVRQRGSGVKKGVEAFERAIALDPMFARAHAALAAALELYPYFVGTPPAQIRDRAAGEARRALELDSSVAEAHGALGEVYADDGHWSLAAPEFERAIALEPDSVATRLTYGRLLLERGYLASATRQFEQARRLAPVSPLVLGWIAYALFLDGQTDSAFAERARAIQLDSTLLPVANVSALMSLARGDRDAGRWISNLKAPAGTMSNAPYLIARTGDSASAWRLIRAIESNDPHPWFTDVARATVFMALGDTAHALDALETSSAAGTMWIEYLPLLDPAFDPIRASPRFASLLAKSDVDVATIIGQRRSARR